MSAVTDVLDLAGLRLSAGEGRSFELSVEIEPLELGGEPYAAQPEMVPVRLEVSRMTGNGYALRLRFDATLAGPCMRCLKDAERTIAVDAREVDVPGGGDELSSPYVREDQLDLAGWARDAFALALPTQILCREDCAGLCAVCAADLNEVGSEHAHERAPDPRWAKLSELKLD
ncbi:MAG TPA: DUF177 domain-containing protein [Solirubrobacteraceae bacterium]|jgi:uncharacterized protein|nr:DUF177 domain-containing protein [Solirubrobacteraceae bacterium]